MTALNFLMVLSSVTMTPCSNVHSFILRPPFALFHLAVKMIVTSFPFKADF